MYQVQFRSGPGWAAVGEETSLAAAIVRMADERDAGGGACRILRDGVEVSVNEIHACLAATDQEDAQ